MTASGTTAERPADVDQRPVPDVPRRGRPRDARCDGAILQATLDLLAEGGAGGLSIDGVAARAGVGKATIYRRWTSKEALLLDALGTDTAELANPDTGSLRGDLDLYFEAMIERLRDSEGSDVLPHLIAAACYDPEVRTSLDAYLNTRQRPLRRILQRAQSRGEIGPAIDLKVIVDVLVGPVLYRRLMTGDRIDRSFVRKLFDMVLTQSGLRPG
jgi:AcrR family transcriptional regulator